MKTIKNPLVWIAAAILLSITILIAVPGCSTVPYGWESKFYTIETNITPTIQYQTNTVTRTNVIESVVMVTNVVNGLVNITMTPTREFTVVSEPVVTMSSNVLVSYTYTANTNSSATTGTVSAIANLVAPGSGGLVAAIGAGLWGLWGSLRSRKLKRTAGVLAQGIEVYGETIKALGSTGEKVDGEVKAWMQNHQAQAGVATEVLTILNNTVDNQGAKDSANKIKEFINRP